MIKCKKCKKEIEHPRRGMCLNCYRKTTGLSKSNNSSSIIKSKPKKVITKKNINIPLIRVIKGTPTIKKKIKTTNEDLSRPSVKWWKEYLDSDILKQQEMISNLPLIKELAKNGFPDLSKLDKFKDTPKEELAIEQERFNSHMLTTMMYSYITDLTDGII